MSRIYTYQTYLRIILTVQVDINSAISTRIYYKKPGGTIDFVEATVQNPNTGVIYYDLEPDSAGNDDFLDEVGNWKFWAWVEFSDGRTARGETVTRQVYDKDDVC